MSAHREPIPPNPPRWKQNSDPASIHVPGLDTNAPVHDQIDQIEQLITIKLQNIDENFSKIHHLLASRLLPAVKRYAVGTEPVREAAKFWTSFYEQAAQIRIPTLDDYSSVNETPSEHEGYSTNTDTSLAPDIGNDSGFTYSKHHDDDGSIANTESSFMPGQGAVSSTPATARVSNTLDSFTGQGQSSLSWASSMESPLIRLSRQIEDFSVEDDESYAPSIIEKTRLDEPTPIPSSSKSKGEESAQPLLRNILRRNLYSANNTSTEISLRKTSPMKGKIKTPIPKEFNPYLPPNTKPGDWSGVVDLNDPSVFTPQRYRPSKKANQRNTTTPRPDESDEDNSFDGLPPGMSPPVLMSPARPPRSAAELGLLKLGQTPSKEASARIKQDLIREVQLRSANQSRRMFGYPNSGTESSMSTVATPPSMSRYRMDTSDSLSLDQSLESMFRRVGLDVPPSSKKISTPGLRVRKRATQATEDHVSGPSTREYHLDATPEIPQEPVPLYSDPDSFSDSDSLDDIDATVHPSAAFFMASQGAQGSDDSFGSSNHSSDSLDDVNIDLEVAPVHPFGSSVEDDGFDDDSFDYDEGPGGNYQEETVFGVPPAERIRAQAAQANQQNAQSLRMLGEDLLQDTIGYGAQMVSKVDESPTPAPWSNNSRGQ